MGKDLIGPRRHHRPTGIALEPLSVAVFRVGFGSWLLSHVRGRERDANRRCSGWGLVRASFSCWVASFYSLWSRIRHAESSACPNSVAPEEKRPAVCGDAEPIYPILPATNKRGAPACFQPRPLCQSTWRSTIAGNCVAMDLGQPSRYHLRVQ